ncbi:MAG: hypothetical protein ABH863_03170 [Candidatus Micrarchaeota archaeon]
MDFWSILDTSGGYLPEAKLRYEPIGDYAYAYVMNGVKGVNQAKYDGKTKKWVVEFEKEVFQFRKEPIKNPAFITPSFDSIRLWLANEFPEKNGAQLHEELMKYIKLFWDLPREYDYLIATIAAEQSWLRHDLNSFLFLEIEGQFGGGKTVGLEILKPAMYHGALSSSISGAGMARIIEEQALSVLHDELDVELKWGKGAGDNSKIQLMRQSQRRGQVYVRYNTDGHSFDVCRTFGPQIYSTHGGGETALGQRGLKIVVRKSADYRLPINNNLRDLVFTQKLHDDLFFWSLERIPQKQIMEEFDRVQFEGLSIDDQRQKLFEYATKNIPEKYISWFKELTGRDAELAYSAAIVSKIYGYDALAELRAAFRQKVENEDIKQGSIGAFVREALGIEYERVKGKDDWAKDGISFILYRDFYQRLNNRVQSLNWTMYSSTRIGEELLECGFLQGINRKRVNAKGGCLSIDEQQKYPKGKSLEALFFDQNVCAALNLEIKKEPLLTLPDLLDLTEKPARKVFDSEGNLGETVTEGQVNVS